MAQPIRNVLLIGAGGRLGPSILSALDQAPQLTVSVLARASSKSTFPSHITVHRVADDYPEAELLTAFRGQDAIVSTIATAAAKQQEQIIDAAVNAGVKRFIPSEFGSDTSNEKAMAILPQYFAGKKSTVEYLKSKEKDGLTWTAFVTGCFFEIAMQGFMGFDIPARKATIYDAGNDPFSTTTLSSIGLAVQNALLNPAQTANRYCFISTFTVSQNQILSALENITGDKFDVTHVSANDQKATGMDKMSRGDFSGAMLLIRYINCTAGHGGDFATYVESSNELLGIPQQELEPTLENIVKG